jgi:hypothetical protein
MYNEVKNKNVRKGTRMKSRAKEVGKVIFRDAFPIILSLLLERREGKRPLNKRAKEIDKAAEEEQIQEK